MLRNPKLILEEIANEYGYTHSDIIDRSRFPTIVSVRSVIISVLKDHFKLSFYHISKLMNRDHTSIMHLYYRDRDNEDVQDAARCMINVLQRNEDDRNF